jgi:hypothetical protein
MAGFVLVLLVSSRNVHKVLFIFVILVMLVEQHDNFIF